MSLKNNQFSSQSTTYPVGLSLSLIVGAIILSFVDLMFLDEVLGKMLDLDRTSSLIMAFALGLIGIGVMAHQGAKQAYGASSAWRALIHYGVWILIGLALVGTRLFSATIMELGPETGDTNLLEILGLEVRQIDLIIAPLMLLLYAATGLMVKDGAKHLALSGDFKNMITNWKKNRAERASQRLKQQEEARTRVLKQQEEMRTQQEAVKAHRAYEASLKKYEDKLKEVKDKYRQISTNIGSIKNLDTQERSFEEKIKPSLIKIVDNSIESTQHSIALEIRARANKKKGNTIPVDIDELRHEIDLYNTKRR